MSSTLLPPPREQFCNRSCSNKTHTARENRRTLCQSTGFLAGPSPALGGLQIPLWLGSDPPSAWWLGLAPATLEFWVRFPNERNQGKQAHPVLKYRVPHGSHRENRRTLCYSTGSSRVPVRDGQTSPHRPRLVVSRSTCTFFFNRELPLNSNYDFCTLSQGFCRITEIIFSNPGGTCKFFSDGNKNIPNWSLGSQLRPRLVVSRDTCPPLSPSPTRTLSL